MISINGKLLRFLFFFLATSAMLWTGCDQDDDEDPTDEQELITTVILNFTDGDGNSSSFSFSDTDGIGGNEPVAEEVKLEANTEYQLDIEFKDESDPSDVEDITAEVREEDEEHLLCFAATGVIDIPTTLDTDSDGKPLGLETQLTTTDAGTATLTIILLHEPDKDGDNPCTTGETDVEATFAVTVQ